MKKLYAILSVLFVLFILLGSTGISVFTHSCETDGDFTSYIIKLDDHCEDHEVELPPCCHKDKEKKDCCSDEEVIYKVDFQFFQDFNVDVPFFVVPDDVKFDVQDLTPLTAVNKSEAVTRPPPDGKSGREILINNQVFRI